MAEDPDALEALLSALRTDKDGLSEWNMSIIRMVVMISGRLGVVESAMVDKADKRGSLVDTLSAVFSDSGDRVANGGAAAGHPFQKSWLIKPTTIVSMLLSMIFISMSGCFLLYGVIDRKPPIEILSAVASTADPKSGILEVTITAKRNRYCHGQRFGFIHDKYSFGLDPVEIPPEGFRGPIPSDGIVHWTIPVEVKDYFWEDPDGFVYRAEWRFRCNPLQGTLFPEVVVSSPDVIVIPRS